MFVVAVSVGVGIGVRDFFNERKRPGWKGQNCMKRIFIAVLRDQKLYRIKLPHENVIIKDAI